MVGNITVGIVVLLIVGGIIFGCRIDHQATKEADEKNNSAVKYPWYLIKRYEITQ